MNTNKAPDRIYVAFQWHPATKETEMFASYDKTTHPREIAYIRKDALLEWAKKNQYDSTTIVADNFWQEVIDKLNSM